MNISEIFEKTNFELIPDIASIERNVLSCFLESLHDSNIANSSELFAADCKRQLNIPNKRLLFAGKSKDYWFVAYEQGGLTLSQVLVVIQINENHTRVIWEGDLNSSYPVKTIEDVRKLVISGNVQPTKHIVLYGEKVKYKIDEIIFFPDFEIVLLKVRAENNPVFPQGFTY